MKHVQVFAKNNDLVLEYLAHGTDSQIKRGIGVKMKQRPNVFMEHQAYRIEITEDAISNIKGASNGNT